MNDGAITDIDIVQARIRGNAPADGKILAFLDGWKQHISFMLQKGG